MKLYHWPNVEALRGSLNKGDVFALAPSLRAARAQVRAELGAEVADECDATKPAVRTGPWCCGLDGSG